MFPPQKYEEWVLTSLSESPQLNTPELIARHSFIDQLDTPEVVRGALERLHAKGQVQVERGRWALAPHLRD